MTVIEREREACGFMDGLPPEWGAIVIGGYAVNAWTTPRYSEDLDLVFPAEAEGEVIDYFASPPWNQVKEWTGELQLAGRAFRFTRAVREDVDLTVDLLFGNVIDKTFQVPIAYNVIRARSIETAVPCVETATSKVHLVAGPIVLCLLKCQPMRPTDKDDLIGLLLLGSWDREDLYSLCQDLLPPDLLVSNLRALLGFIKEDETIRIVRRRFPQLGLADLFLLRKDLETDVSDWIDAIQG